MNLIHRALRVMTAPTFNSARRMVRGEAFAMVAPVKACRRRPAESNSAPASGVMSPPEKSASTQLRFRKKIKRSLAAFCHRQTFSEIRLKELNFIEPSQVCPS